ncbi:MAG TPA: 2-C-methyl-D-erythritol 2,4-cyclodiphosphate synthase, partial [Gammaproteobacteria bacterium]|nr:2-C-methyl-D-erythritol 2,4-cyclodiphosphate synthase [Gammaproteobacteria bacterium]
TDQSYSNIDSRILLRRVRAMLAERSLAIINADITILAQAPKMAPHIEAMRAALSAEMNIEPRALNIKATTTEGMGFVGRKEGIAVHAVALLTTA